MHSVNILSLAPDVNDWLANSRHPRILHVFDHACNLINERREILSIVAEEIGNGPFNLVIEDEILFSEHLNIESSISILDNQLTLGDLTINTADAKLWNPCPDWEDLHHRREFILEQLKKLQITNYLEHGGFDTPLDNHLGLLNHQQLLITNYQFSNSLVTSLSIALVNADMSPALTVVQKLAGLGQGLTPAGDDFIMGAIYATWIIHPSDVARVIAEEIKNTAAPLTTSLSAAWLRSVGRGEAGILWHQFFDALIYADALLIQITMNEILKVGETSGADALAGFIGVFLKWAELQNSKIH